MPSNKGTYTGSFRFLGTELNAGDKYIHGQEMVPVKWQGQTADVSVVQLEVFMEANGKYRGYREGEPNKDYL